MDEASGDRILHREHLWTPAGLNVFMFVLCDGAALLAIALTRPSLASAIVGLVVMTAIAAGVVLLFASAARRTWIVVGERTLRFGRTRAFPATAVRNLTVFRGKQEISREKRRLRGDARFFGASGNPRLKGILAPPGAEAAVRVDADPSIGPTHSFLLATREPEQFLRALESATGRRISGFVPSR